MCLPLKGQNLEYATIQDSNFFLNFLEKDGAWSDVIRKSSLNKDNTPTLTYYAILKNEYFPHCWKKFKNRVLLTEGYGRLPYGGIVMLKDYPLETRDSITYTHYYDSVNIVLKKRYPNREEFEEASFQMALKDAPKFKETAIAPVMDRLRYYANIPTYIELGEEKQEVIKHLSYDFIPLDSSQFLFYVRTHKELTIWKCNYPQAGKQSRDEDWEELITYSSDSIYKTPFDIKTKYVLPSGEKHTLNAIQDTSFFEGHIKVIAQGNNTFVINIKTGGIYFIGKKAIEKVGQINLESYSKWLFNKQIFIEDKDAGEIIFFSKVVRHTKNLPFPKINEITQRKKFIEKFKNVIN